MPHYPQVPLDNRLIRPQTRQLRPAYAAPIKQGFTMAGIWCRCSSGRNVTTAHDLSPISAALAAYDRYRSREREWGSRMNNVTADTAKNISNQRAARKASDDNLALHLCYGQIGISAVAAAVRYQGEAKNPAYAPVAIKVDDRGATAA
jgi:hypothetical protein